MLKRYKPFLALAIAPLFLWSCESPGSPDFTLSNKIDTPLIADASFKFLGGRDALIDTTSNEDMSDLFTVDGDNFISLSVEEDFDFGDLDDAIPAVDVDPTSFEAEVGEIRLGDFSSQDDETGNLGEAGFEDLTGQPGTFQQGDLIPAASSPFPVNIELETDFFVSAMIKSGGIRVSIRNELGFDIDELTMELFSDNISLGVLTMSNLDHLTSQNRTLILVDVPGIDPEVELRGINVDVEISWSQQTMQDDPGSLIINNVDGDNLFASEVEAVIPDQSFFSSGLTDFSDDEFLFTQPGHYVELQSGMLSIQNIINSIDIDIETLQISFPELRTPPYSLSDTLVVMFDGESKIQGNNPTPVTRTVDLSGVRIYAMNNQVNYNIFALTEDTQQSAGSDARVVKEVDQLSAEVAISDLIISEAFGVATNKQILLNDDDPANGPGIDLKNDNEAKIIEIDGISDLSKSLSGLEFTNSSLSINYFTNVEIPTTVIGAFLGVDADGNEFFLRGLAGSDFALENDDPTGDLLMNGSQIPNSNLIKFDLDFSGNVNEEKSITFNRDNTNITEFLNSLPVEIRFVGLANINKNGLEEGRIKNPVRFDPKIGVNIPLAIQTLERATYSDTTETNLSGLPGMEDDSEIIEGILNISYNNSLPFLIGMELEFLDDNMDLITTVPLPNDQPIEIRAGAIGESKFVSGSESGTTQIRLTGDQLSDLNRTRSVGLKAGIETTDQGEVRIRAHDSINIQVSGKFTIQNRIN